MWTRGRHRPDPHDYQALASGDRPRTSARPRSIWRAIIARLVIMMTIGSVLFVLIAVLFPRRPAVQYACTKFTGLHLNRHQYPFFYLSFTTFAWIANRNYFAVTVERIQFDVYHWDDKIAVVSMEPRRFPARTRVVEGIQTSATGLTKTALAHLFQDAQDGLISLDFRGQVQIRSITRTWTFEIRSHLVEVNITDWSSTPAADGPCPPPGYTGPSLHLPPMYSYQ